MSRRTLSFTPELYDYLLTHSTKENAVQMQLRERTARMSQANMQIAPEQGQFISFLARLIGAKRILEIGTFTGYSTLWFALSVPDDEGEVITCDINDEWTKIAKRAWEEAKVNRKVSLQLGPALETLPSLLKEKGAGYFDVAFIDADKVNYNAYYEHCLDLVRPGGLILIDNLLWGGKVVDSTAQDEDTIALRNLNEKLCRDSRVDHVLVPLADGIGVAWRLLY